MIDGRQGCAVHAPVTCKEGKQDMDELEELARVLRGEWLKLRLDALERTIDEPLETKALNVSVKAVDTEAGTVDGYLATFNNEDLGKDVILPAAFKATLDEAETQRRAHGCKALYALLWQHDKDEPIGAITSAREDAHGLRIKAEINTGIERGRQALYGLKNGSLAFSIGYRPVRYDWRGQVRQLKEIALVEGSVVTFPMNPEARAA